MRKFNVVERVALGLALAGMVVPTAGFAATPVAPVAQQQAVTISDVQVNQGALTGTLLNSAGQPVDGAIVTLWQGQTQVGATTTNRDGAYSLPVRSGAHYVVAANGAESVVRTWESTVAPPAARSAVTLVQKAGTLRSQDCCADACAPTCGGGCGGGGLGGGVLLGAAGIGVGAILGGIALSKANDAEDDADAAADKAAANMVALQENRDRLNDIQSAIEDADDLDDLQDQLGDLDPLPPLMPPASPAQ